MTWQSLVRLSTGLHKWIALIVGVQVLFWVAGGLVMTVLPIGVVRGEHHAPEVSRPALAAGEAAPLSQVLARSGLASPVEATLKTTPRGLVWLVTPARGPAVALDGVSGLRLPPLDRVGALAAARAGYRGDSAPTTVRFLTTAPRETRKEGPLWRVDFADAEGTTLYISPATGEVVSRRSGVWRFYDLFWRLHVMDWREGENFNHPLIIGAAALTLVMTLTGFVLLIVRLARDARRRRAPQTLSSS